MDGVSYWRSPARPIINSSVPHRNDFSTEIGNLANNSGFG
jgi:hypothetical protein